MKIKEYEVRGNMIHYFTDDGEFAYPADKFSSVDDVKKEITKKLAWVEKQKLKDKKIKILADLKVKDVKDKDVKDKDKDVIIDG